MASPPVWMVAAPEKALVWLRDAVAAGRLTPNHFLLAMADLAAEVKALDLLAGLDLADLFAPTPGDALALRGGPLAEGESWRMLAKCEEHLEWNERAAASIASDRDDPDPERAEHIRGCVARIRERAWALAEAGAV